MMLPTVVPRAHFAPIGHAMQERVPLVWSIWTWPLAHTIMKVMVPMGHSVLPSAAAAGAGTAVSGRGDGMRYWACVVPLKARVPQPYDVDGRQVSSRGDAIFQQACRRSSSVNQLGS